VVLIGERYGLFFFFFSLPPFPGKVIMGYLFGGARLAPPSTNIILTTYSVEGFRNKVTGRTALCKLC
jgi:hypothetical protein